MDVSVILSLLIGILSLIVAFVLEGGALGSLLQPTAALIVFGGTIGAIGISFPPSAIKKILRTIKDLLKVKKNNKKELIELLKEMSAKARLDGMLSLESYLTRTDIDKFLIKGLQLAIDGVQPEVVRTSLENINENISEGRLEQSEIFEAAGGFAPTMGIIGTVMGLVQVLGNLSNPNELGPKIAVAFIATLYGVASANLLWIPIANRIKYIDKLESLEKEIITEGIILIQQGVNPNSLETQLQGFLND